MPPKEDFTANLDTQAKAQLKAIEDAAFALGVKAENERLVTLQLKDLAEATAAGAKTERERIRAVEAAGAGMAAHDKLVAEMKYDGSTTGPQAAEKLLAAEKASREARLSTMRSEAPKPVPNPPAPEPAGNESAYDPTQIGLKARQYRTEMEAKGVKISAREAADHVLAEAGLKVGTDPAIPAPRK